MIFISPPFGNYIHLPNTTPIRSSFTLNERPGDCGKLNSNYKYIKYSGIWRTLCFDCFIDKNDELRLKYEKNNIFLSGKCLIKDDDY